MISRRSFLLGSTAAIVAPALPGGVGAPAADPLLAVRIEAIDRMTRELLSAQAIVRDFIMEWENSILYGDGVGTPLGIFSAPPGVEHADDITDLFVGDERVYPIGLLDNLSGVSDKTIAKRASRDRPLNSSKGASHMAPKSITAESITADLKAKGWTNIPGIGKLTVKDKPARKGRNPLTGAEIDIPAKKAVKFSVAKPLKDALNS